MKLITNIGNFGSFIGRTLPTLTLGNFFADMAAWYWNFRGLVPAAGRNDTDRLSRHVLGGILAFCLCFFASANLVRNKTTRFVARRFLEFCRTVPDIVFALIASSSPSASGRWRACWR